MMIVVVVDDDDYDDKIKLYEIENYQDKFQKFFKSNCLFTQCFLFFKKSFSKSCQERGEGWGGVMQEHESPNKKL
jgi:hypothetical protein